MTLPAGVADAWRAWQATPVPAENFRAANARALTYGIECDLDHQADYLAHLVEQFAAGNPRWDFAQRAGYELEQLHDFRERVLALELPPTAAGPLLAYAKATEHLLRAVLQTVAQESGGRPGSKPPAV